jgi:hypothetical protein
MPNEAAALFETVEGPLKQRMVTRALARQWADRVVRFYASAALAIAGFASASTALSSLPEIVDDETLHEARVRVNAAYTTLLGAREVPSTEKALVATLAAREAVFVALREELTQRDLKRIVEAMHSVA